MIPLVVDTIIEDLKQQNPILYDHILLKYVLS